MAIHPPPTGGEPSNQGPFPLDGERCRVIVEIAQAHDGSLGMAHAYIDAAARAGAHAVKFQTHIAAAESTRREPWRTRFNTQDATRFDYWRRMEFDESQWLELADHARGRGLHFLSSPFSSEAVELLARVGVSAFKVASGEVASGPLFDAMAEVGVPVLISTGMSPWTEIDAAVERARSRGLELAVLQCTSLYPTPPEKVGLGILAELRRRYGCPIGLSDHSGTVHAGVAAATLGADLVEVHLAFSREVFSPDLAVSLVPEELARLVEGVDLVRRMLTPVDKDVLARELAPMRRLFTKSVVSSRSLPAGRRLTRDDLGLKKPGTGLPPERLGDLVGRRLTRALDADAELSEADLEPEPTP
ncbi:MAG: N-acetylneuraminate synthase family protein [Holophagales bacterium]|nr:N-acetylneuraminate synthase family protein [Holophagales bacterium]